MTNIVVTGSRKVPRDGRFFIDRMLRRHREGLESITFGGAIGVDATAAVQVCLWRERPFMRLVLPYARGQVARENSFVEWDEVIEMPENTTYMDRNEKMLDHGDMVVAFPYGEAEVLRSGTWATVRRAEKRGYPVHIYPMIGYGPVKRMNS